MKRFLLQGNYIMFDYFHTRVYPFENLRVILPNFHPNLPLPPSFAKWKARCCLNWSPPCCLNRKLWRRTPWTKFSLRISMIHLTLLEGRLRFRFNWIWRYSFMYWCLCKAISIRTRSWISNSHSNWKIGLVQSEIISFSLNLPNPWF